MNNTSKSEPKLEKSETIAAMPLACADELAAVEFFEKQRWNGKPTCPHCDSADVYKMTGRDGARNKRFLWRCRGCAAQYTVRLGTVYEETRLPLRHWAYAFWRSATSKKGVSALEIKRQCQITYKSALFLMHRVRFAMTEDNENRRLGGTIEVDETYCGGTPRPEAGTGDKPPGTGYRKDSNKVPVVAMVQRGGKVRTKVVPIVSVKNLYRFVYANIRRDATVNTDQAPLYRPLLKAFDRHDAVNHSQHEYARHNADGTVSHTNTAESFFSLLKRGLMGTFHAVSKEHLHRYCEEFSFRWNTRGVCDGDRLEALVQNSFGKRLTYANYVS